MDQTRPMPDRVKETIFNILASRFGCPGTLPLLRVADAFAGSGSMGLEALSRGAGSCCFFERGREALEILRRNLESLAVGPEGVIIARDAWRYALTDSAGRPFELVFLDPPYRDSADTSASGRVRRYLQRLLGVDGEKPLVVFHHPGDAVYELAPHETWRVLDQRTMGSNSVTFFGS